MKTKSGISNLLLKVSTIFGATLATLSGVQSTETPPNNFDNLDSNTIQVKDISKVKPMPILKLNFGNPNNSQFVAQHTSHSSHSSHSSHYSHRSGAMFS